MDRRISALLVAASMTAAASPLWAQSLADLSKSEEERRKTITAPAKVYTKDDLKASPMPAADDAAADPAAAPAAGGDAAKGAAAGSDKGAKPADVKPADGAKDQAYWAGKAKDLHAQLDRDRSYADALQSRINALNTDFANRSDPAQRALVEQDRDKALAEAERLSQAIVNDQKALSDLDEEARQAGVPPGWLR